MRASPILVAQLFPKLLDELLVLLKGLSLEDWNKPTACRAWSVKNIALHLWGDDIGVLSRKRDRYFETIKSPENWDELVKLINHLNETWIQATRRISPSLLCDLLQWSGTQVCQYFDSLDPFALGDPVDWVGPGPAPVWMDLAREYTERWHHQQQIRDAVGEPGLYAREFFFPVLDAFVRALPHTYRHVNATEGTVVALTITGASGGRWFLRKEKQAWTLHSDVDWPGQTEVTVDQEVAWKLFTKGISPNEGRLRSKIVGDESLGSKVFEMVSVIA